MSGLAWASPVTEWLQVRPPWASQAQENGSHPRDCRLTSLPIPSHTPGRPKVVVRVWLGAGPFGTRPDDFVAQPIRGRTIPSWGAVPPPSTVGCQPVQLGTAGALPTQLFRVLAVMGEVVVVMVPPWR